MENFMEMAKQKLSQRFVNDIAEQDALDALLKVSGEHRLELLKWVMKNKKVGFVASRKQAGLEFVEKVPDEGWIILEELIKSDDPDDRETACEILEEIDGSRSYPLIKILLDDKYPSLQFEACDYLSSIFPKDVKRTLERLRENENPIVGEAAKNRLAKLDL